MTFARDLANFADVSAQNLTFRNKIINGDFGIWQRGTSFTSTGYTSDRWVIDYAGGVGTTSRQTFTAGAAPVAGYESTFFLRKSMTTGAQYSTLIQRIEDVRTFAGQTATLSFWAKGTNPTGNFEANLIQNFGSGGSADVALAAQAFTVTGSWVRYSFTFNVPSISGKTIGTSSYLFLSLYQAVSNTSVSTLDIWGVQLEAGSSASAFELRPAQTELALCQRYYQKSGVMAMGCESVNLFDQRYPMTFPVTMRIAPTMAVHTVTYTLTTNLRTGTITTSNFTFYFNKAGSSGTLQDTSVNGGYEASAEL